MSGLLQRIAPLQHTARPLVAGEQLLGLLCACVFVATYALALACSWPTLSFTSDSWSYYELARTFDTGDPFRFNTFRSYIPATREYSGSFPPGFPFLLHLVHRLFGAAPEHGVFLSLFVAALTPFAAASLSNALLGRRIPGFACGTMLAVCEPYVGGVTGGGGSISMAILLILVGLRLLVQSNDGSRTHWLALGGLFLGWAALVRFDALVFALALAGYVALFSRRVSAAVPYLLGVAAGAAPWALFGLRHFGSPWFSDNSWVAIAAIPAYVTDYRPEFSQTLFSQPALWAEKALHNAYWMARGSGRAMKDYPAIFVLAAALPFMWKWRAREPLLRCAVLVAVACAALLPQFATGYNDPRYYLLLLLTASLAACAAMAEGPGKRLLGMPAAAALLTAAVLANGLLASFSMLGELRDLEARRAQAAAEDRLLAALAKCHAREPETLYLFKGPWAARYGALYGNRTGIIPRNWEQLDDAARERFRREYGPFRAISLERLPIETCRLS
jgi:hypothetical protein